MNQKTIETSIHNLQWSKACCKCGSPEFKVRPHTENVVSWTVVGVTAYRKISVPIPVCNRCFYERYFWYGTAIALAALTLSISKYLDHITFGGVILGGVMLVAVALGFLGTRRQPLNMLKFTGAGDLLTLRVYNEVTANALLAADGAKEVAFPVVRRGYLLALGGLALVVIAAMVVGL